MRPISLFVLIVPMLIGGCAVKGKAFIGTWLDEGLAVTEVQNVGGKATVVSVVDSDNEVFDVTDSSLDANVLTWTYVVPSTKYNVTIVAYSPVDGTMQSTWSNDHDDSGSEELTKGE